MTVTAQPGLHVSVVAIPDAVLSTLGGVFDVLASVQQVAALSDAVPAVAPFKVEIVGERDGPVQLASGVPISTHKAVAELPHTDIVIVPSIRLPNEGWEMGRYPQLTAWLEAMHAQGATLCSACSGVFLIAETGLLDGKETAVHWPYARAFRQAFPAVAVHPDRALLTWGEHDEYVSSGASSSWHDLVLYLIARYVNPAAAQAVAQYFALQWHRDGLAPYVIFHVPGDHGDALIADAQQWLGTRFAIAGPVEEIVRRSGVPERSFKRRFTKATGFTPIAYVQRLRIEDAKRRLERTNEPIDEISWRVGYEDPAFFRRLFKRTTGITPGAYRRKFEIPSFATPNQGS
jgi:transcriptional regulator GlxA family with amidase domain